MGGWSRGCMYRPWCGDLAGLRRVVVAEVTRIQGYLLSYSGVYSVFP